MTNAANKENNNALNKIRAIMFVIILAWMVLGPAYRQVLGGKSQVFRQWTMYSKTGLDLVDARFYIVKDGKLQEIDRFEILGYKNRSEAPKEIFRIQGNDGVVSVANLLCEKLGSNADVRVKSRIATKKGWEQQFTGEGNLCSVEER